jgi:uncharacterized protein (TIGR03067 family)
MPRTSLVFALLSALCVSLPANEPDVTNESDVVDSAREVNRERELKHEREALLEYWEPVRYIQGLTLTDDLGFGDFSADIYEEHWLNRYRAGQPFVWRYTIDPFTEPKQIEFEGRRQIQPGVFERYLRLGIYEVEGERMRLCFSAVEPVHESHRPRDFSARPGSGRILIEFERTERPEPPRAHSGEPRPSTADSDGATPAVEREAAARRPSPASPALIVPLDCPPLVPLPQ